MKISISTKLYTKTLAKLSDAIGDRNYFSGCIIFNNNEIDYCLITSVIVYRQNIVAPDGNTHIIKELIPVWWEFHTSIDGEEHLNDFSFEELNRYL